MVIALPAGAGQRTVRMVSAVCRVIAQDASDVVEVHLPAVGLPSGAVQSETPPFVATPTALVDSWRIARHLEALTEPGDTVLVPDRRGFGGMFALEQSGDSAASRRIVWTIAGDGVGLEAAVVAGTTGGLTGEAEFAHDWEITQYRFSDRVLAVSDMVADLVAPHSDAVTVVLESDPPAFAGPSDPPTVWMPEPVSRRSQSHRTLRALAEPLVERPGTNLVVATLDADDDIWSGTSWDVIAPNERLPGVDIKRSELVPPGNPIVVLGDVLALPTGDVAAARNAGSRMIVPTRGATASLWPDAATWCDEDELAAAVVAALDSEPVPPHPTPSRSRSSLDGRREAQPDRAARVSVGVPVYQNVAYLDECVESVLAQSDPVHELLLIDDGSNSPEVDAALAGWALREPMRIRALRQPNRGVCVARNRLIAEMTGDAFLLVDQDDLLDPDFIRLTAQALRQDGSLWAVAAWTEFFGDYAGVEAKPPFDRRVGLRENPIVSTAALVDMRVRDEGIAFAPDLAFIFCEDWHYWSQVIAAGGRMGLVPRALVRHRVHLSSGGFQRTELAAQIGTARAIEPLRSMRSD